MVEHALDAKLPALVLEGSEAGGHVGSLTSLGLWEDALARIEASPHRPLVVLAGGIGDAASAAIAFEIEANLGQLRRAQHLDNHRMTLLDMGLEDEGLFRGGELQDMRALGFLALVEGGLLLGVEADDEPGVDEHPGAVDLVDAVGENPAGVLALLHVHLGVGIGLSMPTNTAKNSAALRSWRSSSS